MIIPAYSFTEIYRSLSKDIGKDVQVHPLNHDRYLHEEIFTRLDQISNPSNMRCVIEKPTAEFFPCSSAPTRTTFPQHDGSVLLYCCQPGRCDLRKCFALHHDDNLLKGGYCIVILNGRHRRSNVWMLEHRDSVRETADPLRRHYALRIDGTDIWSAEPIKLSKMAKISNAILRHKEFFTNTMQSPLSYTRALKATCPALFWCTRCGYCRGYDVLEFSGFQLQSSLGTLYQSLKNIHQTKRRASRLTYLGKESPAAKYRSITHVNDRFTFHLRRASYSWLRLLKPSSTATNN